MYTVYRSCLPIYGIANIRSLSVLFLDFEGTAKISVAIKSSSTVRVKLCQLTRLSLTDTQQRCSRVCSLVIRNRCSTRKEDFERVEHIIAELLLLLLQWASTDLEMVQDDTSAEYIVVDTNEVGQLWVDYDTHRAAPLGGASDLDVWLLTWQNTQFVMRYVKNDSIKTCHRTSQAVCNRARQLKYLTCILGLHESQ